MKRLLTMMALLLLWLSAPGLAATIYIDKSISNCASTYNPATRLCSGGSAASYNDFQLNMASIMPAGTIVEVRSGTYTQAVSTMPVCTAALPCIVRSYQNEDVIHRASGSGSSGGVGFRFFHASGSAYTTISGAGTDNGHHFIIDGDNVTSMAMTVYSLGHHITITNLEIRDAPTGNCLGMWSNTVTDVIVTRNKLHDCGDVGSNQHHGLYLRGPRHYVAYNEIYNTRGGHGIHQWDSGSVSNDNVVEYNTIYDNDSRGILIGSGDRNIARFNVVYGNALGGMEIGRNGASDNLVYNNTIYNNSGACIIVDASGSGISTRPVMKNNICSNNSTNTVNTNTAVNATSSNNTLTTSPVFKSATTDFSVLAGGAGLGLGTSTILASASGTTFPSGTTFTVSCNGPCDTGAHESPEFASCSVEDGDATKIRVLFSTGSTMRGSAIANWAAVVAGSGVTESGSPTVVGTTRMDITVPAVTNGQSVTIAYTAPASSPLSDSLSIGGSRHSAVRSFTAQACTNNVGAAPTTTLEQIHFEWFEWYGAEDTGSSLQYRACGEDQGCEFPTNSRVLLRLKMVCLGGNCAPTTVTVRYSLGGGSYTEIPNVVGADKIHYAACPGIPHLTDTTERLTAGSALFVAGKVLGAQASLPNVDLDENDTSEFGYCVGWTGATVTNTYDLCLYTQEGTALDNCLAARATIGYGGMVMKAP